MIGDNTKVVFDWLKGQPVVFLLLILSIVDVLSGVFAAIITRKLSSDLSYKGMTRKAFMWMIVAVSGAITYLSPDIPVLKLTAAFYCVMEGISIFENAGRAGVPIPKFLKESLSKLNPESETTTITTTTTGTVTTTTGIHPAHDKPPLILVEDKEDDKGA